MSLFLAAIDHDCAWLIGGLSVAVTVLAAYVKHLFGKVMSIYEQWRESDASFLRLVETARNDISRERESDD